MSPSCSNIRSKSAPKWHNCRIHELLWQISILLPAHASLPNRSHRLDGKSSSTCSCSSKNWITCSFCFSPKSLLVKPVNMHFEFITQINQPCFLKFSWLVKLPKNITSEDWSKLLPTRCPSPHPSNSVKTSNGTQSTNINLENSLTRIMISWFTDFRGKKTVHSVYQLLKASTPHEWQQAEPCKWLRSINVVHGRKNRRMLLRWSHVSYQPSLAAHEKHELICENFQVPTHQSTRKTYY